MKKLPIEEKLNIKPEDLHAYNTGLLQGVSYSRLHASLSRALNPFAITIPEWKLLGQLHEHEKLKLSLLAGRLNYDPPMVTKLIKQLEKKGLAKRQQDNRDERAKIISITPEGTYIIEKAEPAVTNTMCDLLQGITQQELLIYLKVLTAIVNNTER